MFRCFALLTLITSSVLGSRVQQAGSEGVEDGPRKFRFYVINNSTLPLNFLGLPTAQWAQYSAHVKNGMLPGQETEFLAAMVNYQLHATLDDGQRKWQKQEEAGWGLAKYASSKILGMALHGMTKFVAVSALGMATVALPILSAPMVTMLAAAAANQGISYFTSMAASYLTGASLDLVRHTTQQLLDDQKSRVTEDVLASANAQGLYGEEELFLFLEVVRTDTVRDAVKLGLPAVDLERAVMTKSVAETYYEALQEDFTSSRMSRSSQRKFVISGGFFENSTFMASDGAEWSVLDFLPLQIGEVHPRSGCRLVTDHRHWRKRMSQCRDQTCSKHGENPEAASCLEACQAPIHSALVQELQIAARNDWLARKAKPGQRVEVIDDKDLILTSSIAAGLPNGQDNGRLAAAGVIGDIQKLNRKGGSALVKLNGTSLEFPFEALVVEDNFGQLDSKQPAAAIFVPGQRAAMAQEQPYGECWSKCRLQDGQNQWMQGALKFAFTLGRPLWCYSSQGEVPGVCRSDDDCGSVEEDASEWHCTGSCG